MVGKKERRYQCGINMAMTIISAIMILPLLLMVMASVTDNKEILRHGYSFFPGEFSLAAYQYIWKEKVQILQSYFITVAVTGAGTAVGIGLTVLYAYVLAKPAFPGKKFLAFYLFFTMLFNGGLVPTYIMYTRYLHIKNTLWALIIPNLMMNAFNVILVRTYIQANIPQALVEAAEIDGASEYTIFGRIALPLAKPILATVGLFIGIGYWNDWTNGLYYVTDAKLFSVQQLLNNMLKNIEYLSKNASSAVNVSDLAGSIPQETVRMAIAFVGIIPVLIVYPFVQKYFVKGIAVGAVKG